MNLFCASVGYMRNLGAMLTVQAREGPSAAWPFSSGVCLCREVHTAICWSHPPSRQGGCKPASQQILSWRCVVCKWEFSLEIVSSKSKEFLLSVFQGGSMKSAALGPLETFCILQEGVTFGYWLLALRLIYHSVYNGSPCW